jgi:hypothetical protein
MQFSHTHTSTSPQEINHLRFTTVLSNRWSCEANKTVPGKLEQKLLRCTDGVFVCRCETQLKFYADLSAALTRFFLELALSRDWG